MTIFKSFAVLGLIGATAACTPVGPHKTVDRGINSHDVTTMIAGVWVDPDGCDHWIIDDGVEGYMSERLTPDGRPVCSGVAQPNTVVGPFKDGSPVPDIL